MKNKVFKKIETAKYRPLQLHSLQQQPSTENSDKIPQKFQKIDLLCYKKIA